MAQPGQILTDINGVHLGNPARVRVQDDVVEKKCDVCNLWKSLTQFHINKNPIRAGRKTKAFRSRCRGCYSLKRLAWQSNKDSQRIKRSDVEASYVYFIQCGDFVKIGKANNVEQRRVSGKTFNPYPLNVLGVIKCDSEVESYSLETKLHQHFRPWHHEGEWFTIGHQILDFIASATK